MFDLFNNLSGQDIEIVFEPYPHTEKFKLHIGTPGTKFTFILTKEQADQIRMALRKKCDRCGQRIESVKAYSQYNDKEKKFETVCFSCSRK